jgi:hypothetical protein
LSAPANRRLETGGALAALMSSAVEQTLLTHVSCTNLWLKLPDMTQKKFLVPQIRSWWLVFDLLWPYHSLLVTLCHICSINDVQNTRYSLQIWAHQQWNLLGNLCMAGAFLSFVKCVCLSLEVSYKITGYMLFFTVGHYEFNAWYKCYCLLAIIVLDWMLVVRSCWLRTCRSMFSHSQKGPVLVWCRVTEKLTLSRCFMIRPLVYAYEMCDLWSLWQWG